MFVPPTKDVDLPVTHRHATALLSGQTDRQLTGMQPRTLCHIAEPCPTDRLTRQSGWRQNNWVNLTLTKQMTQTSHLLCVLGLICTVQRATILVTDVV